MEPAWSEVALAALNVVQTIYLAHIAAQTRANAGSLQQIEEQSRRRRASDNGGRREAANPSDHPEGLAE